MFSERQRCLYCYDMEDSDRYREDCYTCAESAMDLDKWIRLTDSSIERIDKNKFRIIDTSWRGCYKGVYRFSYEWSRDKWVKYSDKWLKRNKVFSQYLDDYLDYSDDLSEQIDDNLDDPSGHSDENSQDSLGYRLEDRDAYKLTWLMNNLIRKEKSEKLHKLWLISELINQKDIGGVISEFYKHVM